MGLFVIGSTVSPDMVMGVYIISPPDLSNKTDTQ